MSTKKYVDGKANMRFSAKESQIPTFLFSTYEDDTRYPMNTKHFLIMLLRLKTIYSILVIVSFAFLSSNFIYILAKTSQ